MKAFNLNFAENDINRIGVIFTAVLQQPSGVGSYSL
jgi:hypothetical protein